MRRISNIALICILVKVVACHNIAYAGNTTLRIPSSFQAQGFLGRVRRVAEDKGYKLVDYHYQNIVPVITPFVSDGEEIEIDRTATARLIDYLISNGVRSVLVMGATGEFTDLPNEKRLEYIKLFAEESKGRLAIFANATGDTEKETLENIKEIGKLQHINAIVIAPLYYLDTNDEIASHVNKIESKLPLIFYNNPGIHRGINIKAAVVAQCKDKISAIKDSSEKLEQLSQYVQHIATYQGDEGQIVPALEINAVGSVASMGNVLALPQLIFDPFRDRVEVEEIQTEINRVRPALTANLKKTPAALKYYLSLVGICSDRVVVSEKALNYFEKKQIKKEIVVQIQVPVNPLMKEARNKIIRAAKGDPTYNSMEQFLEAVVFIVGEIEKIALKDISKITIEDLNVLGQYVDILRLEDRHTVMKNISLARGTPKIKTIGMHKVKVAFKLDKALSGLSFNLGILIRDYGEEGVSLKDIREGIINAKNYVPILQNWVESKLRKKMTSQRTRKDL